MERVHQMVKAMRTALQRGQMPAVPWVLSHETRPKPKSRLLLHQAGDQK